LLSENTFSLEHPEIVGLRSYAFKSIKIGMVNFVLLSDVEFNHPWLLCQVVNFVDVIITENNFFHTSWFNAEIG